MPEVKVDVEWVEQETDYYCGPAVAQMTLTALGVKAPSGASTTWQQELWAAVKKRTNAVRPTAAPAFDWNPAFPEQRCLEYLSDWKCWTTTPGTLKRILNSSQTPVIFSVRPVATEDDAIGEIVEVLDRGVPCIVLVYGWTHWIVIESYEHGDPSSRSVNVAGKHVNAVGIRDPQRKGINDLPLAGLRERLWGVQGGKYETKIVVMAAKMRVMRAPAPPKKRTKKSGGKKK